MKLLQFATVRHLRAAVVRRLSLVAAVFLATSAEAMASTSGGLPWDTPIQTLQNDLTGPVATGISVIAFLAAGAALVFGEELGGIAKKALYVVLGVAMIVMGNKFLSALGLSGAVI
ncbi:Conjugal transfer protein TrbC [Thiomonas sp. X19]|uniref:TrbC/VirB2 family protein n=1 Tax=Thiomonas sp. X19 TaxID=1050370 RepID=UPI000B67081B|nr:TrbC/VirB2 family protein [Thiomonas sp. X19]SCC93509.1 Conjugal transfer protein TrbC [Thiomonas sp. X19]